MSCKHPLKGFPIGLTDNGKVKYKITSYKADHVEYDGNNWIPVPYEHISPRTLKVVRDSIDIPCGQCVECRLQYSRQWADRCMLELKQHSESWFVTLTYDNAHLPMNDCINPYTGEVLEKSMPTLVKSDVQKFIKRLRKKYDRLCEEMNIENSHLKYFLAGEYGDRSLRPHYHLIIFGLHLFDLVPEEVSELGDQYFTSDFIASCWTDKNGNPIGIHRIGNVTWESCAYVARYIMKKQKGENAKIYEEYNFAPEFTLMSLKPAIGLEYFEDNVDNIFTYNATFVATSNGSVSIKPPRYYEKKYEILYPEEYASYKENKKLIGEMNTKLKKERTSLPYLEMLRVEEESVIAKTKILKRRDL